MTISYEEVRRCPCCQEVGTQSKGNRLPSSSRGTSCIIFTCQNARCRWHDTNWIVEIMPDGTIHPPMIRRPKQFPPLPIGNAKLVASSLQELYERSRTSGAELTR